MGKTGYTCVRHVLCGINLFFWVSVCLCSTNQLVPDSRNHSGSDCTLFVFHCFHPLNQVLGCCILSIGIWLHVSWETYARILPSYHVLSADNLAIVSGALMILIAFCGCCGSWFQSKCLLISYLTVIVAIMVLEITAGTLGYFFRHTIKDTLHMELADGLKFRYSINDTNGMVVTWDQVQTTFNCCGVDSYRDWYRISAWPENEWVPSSCCVDDPLPLNITEAAEAVETSNNSTEAVCGRDPDKELSRFKTSGCFKKIRHWILEHLHYVGLTCIVFAFIQFFSIVAALLVVCTMDYKRGRPRKGSSRPTYNRVPTLVHVT